MQQQRTAAMVLAALLTAAGAAPAATLPLKGSAYLHSATVGLKQARAKALAAQPGVVVDQELEREVGGHGLRYSFDIRAGKVMHEVGIDAKTGKVLENSIDNGND